MEEDTGEMIVMRTRKSRLILIHDPVPESILKVKEQYDRDMHEHIHKFVEISEAKAFFEKHCTEVVSVVTSNLNWALQLRRQFPKLNIQVLTND